MAIWPVWIKAGLDWGQSGGRGRSARFSWEVCSWILMLLFFGSPKNNTLIALMAKIRSKDYSDEIG